MNMNQKVEVHDPFKFKLRTFYSLSVFRDRVYQCEYENGKHVLSERRLRDFDRNEGDESFDFLKRNNMFGMPILDFMEFSKTSQVPNTELRKIYEYNLYEEYIIDSKYRIIACIDHDEGCTYSTEFDNHDMPILRKIYLSSNRYYSNSEPVQVIEYDYDMFGKHRRVSKIIIRHRGKIKFFGTYKYDSNGNRTVETDWISGKVTMFEYTKTDVGYLPVSEMTTRNGTFGDLFTMEYCSKTGLRTKQTLNGIEMFQIVMRPDGKPEFETRPNLMVQYTYDKNGNCVQSASALIKEEGGVNINLVKNIYDKNNNLLSQTTTEYVNGVKTPIYSKVQYQYDKNGNMIVKISSQYKLKQCNKERREEFRYDEHKRLIWKKTDSGCVLEIAYDEKDNIIEYDKVPEEMNNRKIHQSFTYNYVSGVLNNVSTDYY